MFFVGDGAARKFIVPNFSSGSSFCGSFCGSRGGVVVGGGSGSSSGGGGG